MSQAESPRRLEQLRLWAQAQHPSIEGSSDLVLAAGDASFRRYYRLTLESGETRMLMDAPPPQEDVGPFVAIARDWHAASLPVPRVYAVDADQGFVELEDLGDEPLHLALDGADEATTHAHFDAAIALLEELQRKAPSDSLPPYDAVTLARELDLFPDWCLAQWLELDGQPPGWPALRQALIEQALAQPVVTVHRDFDAMNLMRHAAELWLIDFQDALAGPITYDLISLLHGRYRRFDAATRAAWSEAFRQRAIADGRLSDSVDSDSFLRWVNAMAAQRALKVLGIFCRLTLRDQRDGYLARLPHFLAHLQDSLEGLEGLAGHADFSAWVEDSLRPLIEARVAEVRP